MANLLFDVEMAYSPLELYKLELIKQFVANGNDAYITTARSDYLEFIKKQKNTSPIHEELNSKKNKKDFKLMYYSSLLVGIASIFIYIVNNLWLVFGRSSNLYKSRIMNLRYKGIKIGDCLASEMLRNDKSNGYLSFEKGSLIEVLKFILKLSIDYAFIKKISALENYERYFFCIETTYYYEALRRTLVKFNFKEIIFDCYAGKTVVIPPMEGWQIRKASYARTILDAHSMCDEAVCEKLISDIVHRVKKYSYMLASDVNTDLKINTNDIEAICNTRKKIAVIYMHAVSDAQYFYGTDCFTDLDDWLKYSIQELLNLNFLVIVKLHPSYFSDMHLYPSDKNYLSHIYDFYGFSYCAKDSGKVIRTNKIGLFFMGHEISIKEIKSTIGYHITVTHHGSVALESAYLGIPVIASIASPYLRDLDQFVYLYESKEEYLKIINSLIENDQVVNEIHKKSLLRYVDHHLIRRKEFYIEPLFAHELGVDSSSGILSILVEDALNRLDIKSEKVERCREIMNSLVRGVN